MVKNILGRNVTFPIYNADGTPFHNLVMRKATDDSFVMSLGDKVTGDVYYKDNTLAVSMQEYIVNNGIHYILVNPPTIVREGMVSDNTDLKGMTKYSFEFFHPMCQLSNFPFTDVAVTDSEERYLSQNKTFSWIGTLSDFVAKLNANLANTQWYVDLNIAHYEKDGVTETQEWAKAHSLSDVITFDKQFISDALKTGYDTWELPFVVSTKNQTINGVDKKFLITFGLPSNEIYDQALTVEADIESDVWIGSDTYVANIRHGLKRGERIECKDSNGNGVSIMDRATGYYYAKGVTYYIAEEDIANVWFATNEKLTITYKLYTYTNEPFVFKFGQGVGLKNNSRTPKNNKIVTRIVGYGSEGNIPYGYPQIVWAGNQEWDYTLNNASGMQSVTINGQTIMAMSYPIYKGIVGGTYVKLIKHPFTRTTLMPSVYTESVFNKVSPYNADGKANANYNPNIELIDYYDAEDTGTYPNPIDKSHPSVEIHQFEGIKPELGEATILDAYAYAYVASDIGKPNDGGYVKESDFVENIRALYQDSAIPSLEAFANAVSNHSTQSRKKTSGGYNYEFTVLVHSGYVEARYVSDRYNIYKKVVLTLDDTRVDWDDTMTDDGDYVQSYFKIKLPQLSFDLYASAAITEQMQINMRSGACIGCTFPIEVDWEDYKKNFYDALGNFAPDGTQRDLERYPKSNDGSIDVIVKKEIDTFGTLMPNVYQQPNAGDKFVILGISLPLSYISTAEQKLDEAMREYMLENNVYYFDYPLKLDEYFLATHDYILSQIHNNSILRFQYSGAEMALYVKQITIKYGDRPLPQYDITLTDDVEIVLNQIGQVTDDVSRMRVQLSELQKYYSESIINELADKLSRISDDVAQGRITFQSGLNSIERAIFHDELSSQDFESGLYTGKGWHIDHLGNAEFESARVRSFFEVVEFLVNRQQGQEGDTIFSENDQIEMVETSLFAENLLLNSNVRVENNDYLIAKYRFTTPPQVGKTYRFTIHGRLGNGRSYFRLYNSSASCLIKTMTLETEIETARTWQGTSPWSTTDSRGNQVPNDELWVYQYPSDATGASTIEWITMEEVGSETNTYILTLKEKWDGYRTSQQQQNILRGSANTLASKQAGVSDVENSVEVDGVNAYYTSWMRVVGTPTSESTLHENQIRVVLYDDSYTPVGRNFPPCELMNIARWGCDADVNDETLSVSERESIRRRQQTFYISTTEGRIVKLTGVNKPILEQWNYGTTLGIVPDFVKNWSIANRLIEGRDYLYAQGIIVGDFIKVDIDGKPLINYVDCGEWENGKEYLHNEYNEQNLQWETHDAWHNGAYWRCLTHQPYNGTYYEPNDANTLHWKKLMSSSIGTSPVIVDIDNEFESVPCNENGAAESETMLTTNASVWQGTKRLDIQSISASISGVYLTSQYATSQASMARYFRFVYNTQGLINIYVREGAPLSSNVKVTLNIQANVDNATLSRDAVFVIHGAKRGKNGEPATIYKLIPLTDSITKHNDGTYEPSNDITCEVIKIEGSVQSKPSSSEYNLMYVIDDSREERYEPVSPSSVSRVLTFILYDKDGTQKLDQETIYLIKDGEDGAITTTVSIYKRATSVSSSDKPTGTMRYTFASGVLENLSGNVNGWSNVFPSSDGDLDCWVRQVYVTSKEDFIDIPTNKWSDAKIYVSNGKDGNDGKNGKDGNDGNDGVSFLLMPTQSAVYVTASTNYNETTTSVGCTLIIGSGLISKACTATSTSGRYSFTNSQGSTEYIEISYNIAYRFISTSNVATSWSWLRSASGQMVSLSTNGRSGLEFALTNATSNTSIKDDNIIARAVVPIVRNGLAGGKGEKGSIGRNYYYDGLWSSHSSSEYFIVTDSQAPYYSVESSSSATGYNYWVWVGENGTYYFNSSNTPSNSNSNWMLMVDDHKFLISEAFFTDFGKLGSGIFNNDWMYSKFGNGTSVLWNGTSTRNTTQYYQVGSTTAGYNSSLNHFNVESGRTYTIYVRATSTYTSGTPLYLRVFYYVNGTNIAGQTFFSFFNTSQQTYTMYVVAEYTGIAYIASYGYGTVYRISRNGNDDYQLMSPTFVDKTSITPFQGGTTDIQSSSTTLSSSTIIYKNAFYAVQGKIYRLSITTTRISGTVYIVLCMAGTTTTVSSSTMSIGYVGTSASSFTITSAYSGYVDIRGYLSSSSSSCRITEVTISDSTPFIPKVAIDWRSGYAHFGGGTSKFEEDGSGQVANGNVQWDAYGNTTFDGRVKAKLFYSEPYVVSGTLTLNLDSAPYHTFFGRSGYTSNVILPDPSNWNGVELQFFIALIINTQQQLTITYTNGIYYMDEASGLMNLDVTLFIIPNQLVTIKSMSNYWYVISGNVTK